MRKIIVTVAPVCHVGKEIPAECKNPLTPKVSVLQKSWSGAPPEPWPCVHKLRFSLFFNCFSR